MAGMKLAQGQIDEILATEIDKTIFMGSSPFCEVQMQRLRARLEEAFSILSGIQQSRDDDEIRRGEIMINRIVHEIAVALGDK